jgi:hypothetical protein
MQSKLVEKKTKETEMVLAAEADDWECRRNAAELAISNQASLSVVFLLARDWLDWKF